MKTAIVYSSQTGKAVQIASLVESTIKYGYNKTTIHNPRQENKKRDEINNKTHNSLIPDCDLIIYIISTHGDGTHPFTFNSFWNQNNLPTGKFAVFGLGDSSYDKFNYSGKKLYNRLKIEGGIPIIRRGEGDEQDPDGLYTDLKKWLEELSNLNYNNDKYEDFDTNEYNIFTGTNLDCIGTFNIADIKITTENKKYKIRFNHKNKLKAKLVNKKMLTEVNYEKKMLEVEFDIPEYENYKPGDVLSIMPNNYNINEFIETMLVDKDEITTSIVNELDINFIPNQHIFFCLYQLSNTHNILYQIATDYDHYYRYVIKPKRSFFCILKEFSLQLHLTDLIRIVPKIQPRYFTLIKCKETYKIIVSLVNFKTTLEKKGLVSEFLINLVGNIKVEIIRSSLNLENKKFLLICTGSGISLALSILNMFKNNVDIDDTKSIDNNIINQPVLIYGFRYLNKDFLYKNELSNYFKLFTAISRENKEYVQDIFKRLDFDISTFNIIVCGNTNVNKEIRKIINDKYKKQDNDKKITFQSETW